MAIGELAIRRGGDTLSDDEVQLQAVERACQKIPELFFANDVGPLGRGVIYLRLVKEQVNRGELPAELAGYLEDAVEYIISRCLHERNEIYLRSINNAPNR